MGERLGIAEQWSLGPSAKQTDDPEGLTEIVRELMKDAQLNPDMSGTPTEGPGRPSKAI